MIWSENFLDITVCQKMPVNLECKIVRIFLLLGDAAGMPCRISLDHTAFNR